MPPWYGECGYNTLIDWEHPMRRLLRLPIAIAVALACTSTMPSAKSARSPTRWWDGAVFYEVFVRSFQDSDGDGIGDLKGLISRLDYLNDGNPKTKDDLGVDALWLMPIFESPSYHGYDVTNYLRVNPAYGTEADFDRLVAEAHKRGIKIVLDFVMNHSSDQHPWFKASASSPESPYRDWYIWSPTDLGWGQPWNSSSPTWHAKNGAYYYGIFWSGMPDLNFRNPEVVKEMTKIATAWEERGVDGFRLDAIRHLIESGPGAGQSGSPDNHVALRNLSSTLRRVNPRFAMIGEVWSTTEDIAPYFGNGSNELQVLFDFPLASALVGAALSEDSTEVTKVLRAIQTYPSGSVDAPFLTNHDQARVATTLRGDRVREDLAAAMLLTLPGAPFVYYGEEIGLKNGPGGDDEWKRTPMLWAEDGGTGFTSGTPWQPTAPTQRVAPVDVQSKDPSSLLSRYRKLISVRHASSALKTGKLSLVATGTPAVLAFIRQSSRETVLVAHNVSSSAKEVEIAPTGKSAFVLFADSGCTLRRGAKWTLTLAPQSSLMVRLY